MSPRSLREGLALLIALLLTAQGFAVQPRCADGLARAADTSFHCHHAPAGAHYDCHGNCCAVAAAALDIDWSPAARVSVPRSLARPSSPITLAPERLERPPRMG